MPRITIDLGRMLSNWNLNVQISSFTYNLVLRGDHSSQISMCIVLFLTLQQLIHRYSFSPFSIGQ